MESLYKILFNELSKAKLKFTLGEQEKIEYSFVEEYKYARENNHIEIYFQAIIDLEEKKIAGFEALSRWKHPKYGLIPTQNFIEFAEKTGVIRELDEFVIIEGIKFSDKWIDLKKNNIFININVSPYDLGDYDFVNRVIKLFGKRKSYVEINLEITETNNYKPDKIVIEKLKNAGLNIALDDFGTGYASISQVKNMMVDIIKIDISFVSDLGKDLNSNLITTAMINMATSLRLKVVAEGIETLEQLDFFIKNKCNYGQGYLFHKAAKVEEILETDFAYISDIILSSNKDLDKVESKLEYVKTYSEGKIIYQPVSFDGIIEKPNSYFSKITGKSMLDLKGMKIQDFVIGDGDGHFNEELSKVIFMDIIEYVGVLKLQERNTLALFTFTKSKSKEREKDAIDIFIELLEEKESVINFVQDIRKSYKKIFNDSPIAIIISNRNFEVLEWNEKATETFGWEKHDVVGKYILDKIVKKDDVKVVENILIPLLSGKAVEHINDNITKFGKTITCKWYNKLIKDEKGKTSMIISIAEDISKKISAEKMLDLQSKAMNQSNSGIYITDLDSKIEYVNDKFVSITGYSKEKLIGIEISKIKSGKQNDEFYKELWKTIKSGEVWYGQFENRKKDGELYWADSKIYPIFDSSGIITNYLCIQDDITEEKKLREEYYKMASTLTSQEKLASVGVLAAGIIHEINTPISSISSNLQYLDDLLKESDCPCSMSEEVASVMEDLLLAVNQTNSISKSLKKFVYKQNDNIQEYFDLNIEIKNMLILAKNEYKYYADITLELGELDSIIGFPGEIRQVLLNLIINSIYAIRSKDKSNRGKIVIQTYQIDEDVFLVMSDDGIGMTENVKKKIFEPFFTTKESGVGTGIGLNITREIIVKHHKGEISVESEFGKGTTFTIKLLAKND
ncbi:MAG: EAL domain-containing protein [Acidaminobacteraceae bacterium]